jgi:DNA-binding transcriptional MerR regulator
VPSPPSDPAPVNGRRYRVGELARATGISVRNIRVYQERGLLPAPDRDGRLAIYTEIHAIRLRLIDRLLRRGYPLRVIGDLLDAWAGGHDLADLIGLEEAGVSAWSGDRPARMTLQELDRLFGRDLSTAMIRRLVRLDLLRPAGTRSFVVPSPGLVQACAELAAGGVPLRAVVELVERVQTELGGPAAQLTQRASRQASLAAAPDSAVRALLARAVTHTVVRAFVPVERPASG